jgi:hypothetical protein
MVDPTIAIDLDTEEGPEQTLKSIFPATSFEIDPSNYDSNNYPMTNTVLPLSKLIDFLQLSFACRVCRSVNRKKFVIERYGIASSLYFECLKCGANKTSCRATHTEELEEKWVEKPASKRFKDSKKDKVNSADFQLNPSLYLATQQCGGGITEAKVVAGLLGLHSDVLHGRWSTIAEKWDLKIIENAKELLVSRTIL